MKRCPDLGHTPELGPELINARPKADPGLDEGAITGRLKISIVAHED